MTILALTVLCVAAFGQAAFGFGAGLVAIPLLSLLLNVKDAVTLSLLLQVSLGVLVFFSFRSIEWRSLRWLLLGFLPFTMLGMMLLGSFSEPVLRALLSFTLGAYLVRVWFFPRWSASGLDSPLGAWLSGLGAGFLQGLLGTGGPVLVMYLSEIDLSKERFRATLLLLLCLSNLSRILVAAPAGMFSHQVLQIGWKAIPLVPLAMWGGSWVHGRLNEAVYRKGVQFLLLGSLLALLFSLLT